MACFLFLNHVLPRRRRFCSIILFFEDVRIGIKKRFSYISHIAHISHIAQSKKSMWYHDRNRYKSMRKLRV